MPELPEVETVCRGISSHIVKKKVTDVIVRNKQLRWPVPSKIRSTVKSKTIEKVSRRGKYILIHFESGVLLIHLGMSGTLKVVEQATPLVKHDHVDFELSSQWVLRFNDPRRFGSILWANQPIFEHPLLCRLGPEPLEAQFNKRYLLKQLKNKRSNIKSCIMSSQLVVGVGNIYANEALFASGIHPLRVGNTLSLEECDVLSKNIKKILRDAIQKGGTTLKDFTNSEGKPGYFSQVLNVYGRGGQDCVKCHRELTEEKVSGRTTVFCQYCQQ